MVTLSRALNRFKPTTILVVGDLILDSYTLGKAGRISPEAPVAVVHVSREEHRAGGVGNAALNMKGLGSEVLLLGRVGDDFSGQHLVQELTNQNIDTSNIIIEPNYCTPKKNRIIASNQQVVRVDHEKLEWLSESVEQQIIDQIPTLLNHVDAIAISDYAKGFLTDALLRAIIDLAYERGLPVIVDPKGTDFEKYQRATLIKPNLKEAYIATKSAEDASIESVAAKLLEITQAETLMVTRSEEGISLFHQNGSRDDFPVEVKEVKDVTGAGDTVLATVSCSLASGLSPVEAAKLANVAAGISIEHLGCSVVTLPEIAKRLLEGPEKLYEEDHLFTLQQSLKDQPFTLIGLSEEEGISPELFAQIQSIAVKNPLIVYIRDENPTEAYTNMLASLREVQFVILKKNSLKDLCNKISPDQVYIVSDGEIQESKDYLSLLSRS